MNTALKMTEVETITETTPAAETIVELLEGTRTLVETINESLDKTEGSGKTEVSKALANLLNAVARRIEG